MPSVFIKGKNSECSVSPKSVLSILALLSWTTSESGSCYRQKKKKKIFAFTFYWRYKLGDKSALTNHLRKSLKNYVTAHNCFFWKRHCEFRNFSIHYDFELFHCITIILNRKRPADRSTSTAEWAYMMLKWDWLHCPGVYKEHMAQHHLAGHTLR